MSGVYRLNRTNNVVGRISQYKAAGGEITDPTDIAGCRLWIDFSDATTLFTDAGSTPVANNDDRIYQANDKSGNEKHLSQPTEANRPTYKTNIQNGLSIGRLVNDRDTMGIPALGTALTKLTLFTVTRKNEDSGNPFVFIFRSETNPICYLQITNTDHYVGFTTRDTESDVVNAIGSTARFNSFYLISGVANGITNTVYVNGAQEATDTNAAYDTASDYNRIGVLGNYKINEINSYLGDYAEIIVYDSALSDEDRQSVETYLNNKWSLY